uniref:Uncharacterized protein n=1 Tax=Anguilla anguilla TaxID=7936 RepID=A0A0E9QIV3_ANGAN
MAYIPSLTSRVDNKVFDFFNRLHPLFW